MQGQVKKEFKNIYKEYGPAIKRYQLRLTSGDVELAEDLTQETFIRVFKYWENYDPEKGKLSTWIFKIAYNTHFTSVQTNKKSQDDVSFDGNMEFLLANGNNQINQIEQRMLIEEIITAIRTLPEPEKTIIMNREIKKKTLSETAQELKVTIRTVSRKSLRAYTLIREELTKRGLAQNLS